MTARLYWYPEPDGLVRVVDLGRAWRDLADGDAEDSVTDRSADGQRVVTAFTSWRRRRALVEYLDDPAVIREVQAVGVHLRRNGVIGLAEDDGCTWGGFARAAPEQGEDTIRIEDNLWESWSTVDLDVGDVVVVQGASPRGVWEECTISSINAAKRKIVLAEPLRYSYADEPYVLVRDARFWPWLRLEDRALQAPILRSDHRITWSLELALEEPPSRVARAAERGTRYRGPTGSTLVGEAYDADLDVELDAATTSATVRL